MIKKEYFFVFVIAGLAVVYGVLAAVNFFTGGRFQRVLKKKLIIGTMLITLTSVITTGSFAQNISDPSPTPVYGTPTPVVDPMPEYGAPVVTPTPTSIPVPTYATPTMIADPTPTMPMVLYGAPTLGDVNTDFRVDIVDALLIAQYYVGDKPSVFNPNYADVNQDGKINIVDALLIAQKYVGAIREFPKSE